MFLKSVMQQDTQPLIDILHAAEKILDSTAALSIQNFYDDIHLQDVVLRRLLNIAKAAQRVSLETRQAMGDVNWPLLCDLQSLVGSDDHAVDADRLWAIAQQEIPSLLQRLQSTLLLSPEPNQTPEDSFMPSPITSWPANQSRESR
jgi:uncharacterized protein with HEPN domain